MRTWTPPHIPELPGEGQAPRLFNTATDRLESPPIADREAHLYVCGITPYDATHLGHAATYLAYDILQRAWFDAGITVKYAQNITDIDDPLLERALQTDVDWRDLAESQVSLFRSDMYRLGMIPPNDYIAVTERIDDMAQAVHKLKARGLAYEVPTPDAALGGGADLYWDTAAAESDTQWRLGDIAPYAREEMMQMFAERGGDPDREGKRDPLDPLLWRAAREGEPAWQTVLGLGRPGWHIECSVIATEALGTTFTVQGGGADLIFPHHEFSAAHATGLTGTPLAYVYSHVGLVAYQGEKMSKSLGNLVLISKLLDSGVDPNAIRLGILAHHYRSEWEWFDSDLATAERRLHAWKEGLARTPEDPKSALSVLAELRQALANDLDTPVMLATLDAALDHGVDEPQIIADAVMALLGVQLLDD